LICGVLDVFHAIENIAAASRTLFEAGTDEAVAWLEGGRMPLIRAGWPAISEFIDNTRHTATRSVAASA